MFIEQEFAEKPNFTNPWDIVYYETDMLFGLQALRSNTKWNGDTEQVTHINNALLESQLLHTRILVDILISKGKSSKDAGDIKLEEILPKERLPDFSEVIGDLKNIYGYPEKPNTRCWILNKMLAHPTMVCSNSYDYSTVIDTLNPQIQDIIIKIAEVSGHPGLIVLAKRLQHSSQ